MTDDIIAITGHRVYPDRAALYRGLDSMSARQYYFGGAQGVDTDALEHIAKTQPRSARTVVVPNMVANQPASARVAIRKYSTKVIELRNSGPDRYMMRNRFMVQRSDRLAAFYDFRGRGGTYNTIEYARQTGKPFTTFSLREYDVDEFKKMSRGDFSTWLEGMKYYRVPLSSIKILLLSVIGDIFNLSVRDFINEMGFPSCKTLEEFWLR